MQDAVSVVAAPVEVDEAASLGDGGPSAGTVALCLSGGGYRAMMFHLGALFRLNQIGALGRLTRVSSVSGGSILSALLGLRWSQLQWDEHGRATNLIELVGDPILRLSTVTIDVFSGIVSLLPGESMGDVLAHEYRKHLFGKHTLADLPGLGVGPEFVINATSVQTGKLVRFTRGYVADYTVGVWSEPEVQLAEAVAASSAFPPIISPYRIKPGGSFSTGSLPVSNTDASFRDELVLTDGGVYDNLGLQTAWNHAETLLVSDGGMPLWPDPDPHANRVLHAIRVLEVIDSQVRSLRKRQLVSAFTAKRSEPTSPAGRRGAYWGIDSKVTNYPAATLSPFDQRGPDDHYPSNISTRLATLSDQESVDLLQWGYVICDTAIRSWDDEDHKIPIAKRDQIPFGTDHWWVDGGLTDWDVLP